MRALLPVICLLFFLSLSVSSCKPSGGIECPGFKERTATRSSNHPKLSGLQKGKGGVRRTREVSMRAR